jgi:hypothetical protein
MLTCRLVGVDVPIRKQINAASHENGLEILLHAVAYRDTIGDAADIGWRRRSPPFLWRSRLINCRTVHRHMRANNDPWRRRAIYE